MNKTIFIVPAERFPKEQIGGPSEESDIMPSLLDRYLLTFPSRCTDLESFSQSGHNSHSVEPSFSRPGPQPAGLKSNFALVFRVDGDDDDKDDVVASVCVCRRTQGSPRLTEACYLASSRPSENLLAKVPLDRVC